MSMFNCAMAGSMKMVCAALIAAALMAAVTPPCEAALNCPTVVNYLSSCVPYLTGRGPLGKCCGGVKGLYGAAKTRADRQSACRCLKTFAGSIHGNTINVGKAAGLPAQCGVKLPYKISRNIDCNKVN